MSVLLMIVKYKILTGYKPWVKAVVVKGITVWC